MLAASAVVNEIIERYPEKLRASQRDESERIAFHVSLVTSNVALGGTVMDLGGGIGMLSPAVAAAGYESILVDDFGDDVNLEHPLAELGVHNDVLVQSVDITGPDFEPPADSLDAVTCMDSLEHWQNRPRPVLHKVIKALKPGGYFVLGVPNCVDLKKRIATPLGKAPWSPLDEWYDVPVFRSHVREPDVSDLRYIGRDLGLANMSVFGRNWTPYLASPAVRVLARLLEKVPGLCSTIYLEGRKPA